MTGSSSIRTRIPSGELDPAIQRQDTSHWTGRLVYHGLRLLGRHDIHPYSRQLAAYRVAQAHAALTRWLPVSLAHLLRRYGTDKEQTNGHRYGDTYGEWFRRFRYRPIRMLEVGVGGYAAAFGGRSLLAWRAYFPMARIFACDLQSKTQLSGWGVQVLQADQSNANDLVRVATGHGPFDIIIDDGSHINAHQILTFNVLFQYLRDGGIYVVEDVQTSYWSYDGGGSSVGGSHPESAEFSDTCMGYFLRLAKYINHMEASSGLGCDLPATALAKSIRRITFEHNLICVLKGDNDQPSTETAVAVVAPLSTSSS